MLQLVATRRDCQFSFAELFISQYYFVVLKVEPRASHMHFRQTLHYYAPPKAVSLLLTTKVWSELCF